MRGFGAQDPKSLLRGGQPRDTELGELLVELAAPGGHGCALELSRSAEALGAALATIARRVVVACEDDRLLCVRAQDYRQAGHEVELCRARPARLPLAPGSIDVALWQLPLDDLIACRPGLDELYRVLAAAGTLLLAGMPSDACREGGGRSTASICRVLEEHGFAVDATVTTHQRPAGIPPRSSQEGDSLLDERLPTRVVPEPAAVRRPELAWFAWPATLVRARKANVRGYLTP